MMFEKAGPSFLAASSYRGKLTQPMVHLFFTIPALERNYKTNDVPESAKLFSNDQERSDPQTKHE